ncbi:Uncharacterized protein conserved in bacteria [Klebsiella pneumoniae]|nr:Uncharacterized protein conserved in bacteria [Klebsiella pneumoniae]SWY16387.1 Uncharacterized protein conserved in bacteria [Klebsiella pneumoniae]
MHHVKGQTIQQVGAERAFTHHAWQVGVGCANQSYIDLQRLATAYAFQLSVLNNAQQFFLYQHRGGCQFIKKQCAAIGALEPTWVTFLRAGKGARFVPKEFGIK